MKSKTIEVNVPKGKRVMVYQHAHLDTHLTVCKRFHVSENCTITIKDKYKEKTWNFSKGKNTLLLKPFKGKVSVYCKCGEEKDMKFLLIAS